MNAYTDPEKLAEVKMLTSADIDVLFQRKAGWFAHTHVRQQLYARGFPHPASAGRWSPSAVNAWLATAGSNPAGKAPAEAKPTKRRRRRRPSGYAEP